MNNKQNTKYNNKYDNQYSNQLNDKYSNKVVIFNLLKHFSLKNCIFLDFNKNLMYLSRDCFLIFTSTIQFMGRIFNFKIYTKRCIRIYAKKYISTFLSLILVYFQVIFSFTITSSIISAVSIKQSYAFNEIVPPQNIKDNPIDHITPDNSVNIPGTNNNTHLDRTQNGTPMVNINNANNQGISANYYKDFNVDNQNLILNNHRGESINTQLGGVIYGNPNFNNANGREADIILNEITTNRVSNINGYIEVAGKRADVIIANPNGIMVGGAGFINTNRLSMITGSSLNQNTINGTKSSFDQNGNLNPFLLTDTNKNPNAIIQVVGRNITDNNGNIVAYNLGIDAQDVRYADLISRVVKINGNIHGNTIQSKDKPFATEVNIKTGNDRAYYNTDENGNKNNKGFNVKSTVNCELSTVNCEAEAASHKPEFAIDSTAFGGIYAGRINFIATENGVGVRTRSDLIASTDDLNFDVNGNIILEEEGSLYAKKDINLNNKTKAKNKNNNTSPNDKATTENQNNTITNKSTIAAENNINITADELINANTNQNSKIYALNDINIASSLIDNSSNGHINAGNDLNIDNNDYLNNQSGQILSGNNLTIKSDNIDNSNNGYIFANSNMDLINLNNSHGIVEGNGNITIANTAETSKNNEEFQKLNNEHGLILSTNSSNNNSKIIINTTNDLANTNGSIKSNGDIEINVLTDYIISGMLYSNSDININAKNIKNYSDVISGNNITFTANGNIYNGNESTNATIIAMNDIIFNILKDSSDTTKGEGSLFNYGVISANNNIEINAENSIYNGLAMGSNARISSNNNLTLTAENRIINKGYIQTTGSNKDSKLILETRTGINDDYELRNNGLSLDEINNKVNGNKNEALPPELQAKLDNLNNITDVNELYEIIPQLKTEEQYYLVQNRIKILSIKETLSNLNDAYTFNEDDWANKSNEEINEQLQEIFGNNYDEELNNSINNTYNNYLAQKETEIDDQIQQQLNRKQQAEENNQEFNETLLNKDELMAQAEIEANAKKLEKIKEELNSEKLKVSTYLADLDNNNNWASLTNEQINEKLQDILNNNYVAQEWSIPEYQALDSITPITNEYLGSLRINSIDTNKTEQTGIHNYGRIYSNTDMELNSNSVLHNNKGALIYSNNDIAFNINKVLFNNENNMGQGIYANNNITIQGYDTNPYTQKKASLEKLINYDGRIEANNNIDIKSNEVINYGSDSIDLSKVDTEIKPIYDYYYTKGLGFRKKKIYISKEEYERRLASGDTTIGKTFKWYGVEETPELLQSYGTNYNFIQNAGLYQTVLKAYDTAYSKVTSNESTIQSNSGNVNIRANNTTNYNSVIFANNDLTIDTKNLLNKNLEFNVNANQYYQYHGKKKKWTGHAKEYYDEWTSHIVLNVKGDKTSKILAGENLLIAANSIGNGMLEANSNYSSDKKLPYTENNNTNSPLDIIKKTGTLNPLDNAQLPQGNYGIFRQPDNPNSKYLFETDPTLIDTNLFLGSTYFMNRLGLDPDTIDLKFLGDSYMEHQMLERTLNQIMTNNQFIKDNPSQSMEDKINEMYANVDKELQETLNLKFGEPLTEEQLNQLDKDIIWYVKQDITLPDGTIIKDVLVPQIYLSNDNRKLLEQNLDILNTTGSMIAGNNITIAPNQNPNETNDTMFNTILNNSGTIYANNQLSIATNTINNTTTTINRNTSNTTSSTGNQASLIAGNTLILDTGKDGTVNNLSGLIASINDNSLAYINTGTLNNTTNNQRETVEHEGDDNEYKEVRTYIGDTGTIQSNGSLIINAENDINIKGANIIVQNDAQITTQNGNINIDTIEDYNYTYQHAERSGGAFGSTKTMDSIDESNKNMGSNIISNNGSLHIQSADNINIKGSDIVSETGTNLIAENDINIFSSIDANRTYREVKEDNNFTGGTLDINETTTNTNNSSNIISNNGDLNIITGRNTNIVAGNLATNKSGDINILAGYIIDETTGNLLQNTDKDGNTTTGSINILSTQDLEKNYSYHEEWGGFFDMLTNLDLDLSKDGLTLSASYEEELDENTTLTKTARTSNINANNGSINLNATENILSIGTQIYADKDISLNAGYTDKDGNKHDGNIILASADNSQTIDSKHEETTVTVGVKIGNSYVDTANTIANVADYNDALKDAKKERKKIKELYDQDKASKQALDDADGNVKVAEANLAYGILQSLAAVASSAQTASTSFGTGFYANAFVNYDTTSTTSNEQSNWQTQGNIQSGNGNINFNTTNDMTQEGTNLYAANKDGTGTINYNVGNDLTIQASKDTYNYNSKTETTHAGVSVGTKIDKDLGLNGLNAGLNGGAGNSTSKINSETYNNSEVIANNINIKTGNDTNIKGANIEATNDINMNIGNNLNIESLQDTYYANIKDNSWNAGASYSNSGNTGKPQTSNKNSYGISGGESSIKSNTDSKWVNNQTTIIANNNINITTKNNTDIKGSLIASNSDNLNINTGSLTYSNITNFNTTTTKGSGLSTGIGTSADSFFKGTSPNGTTSITHTNEGSEKEGITHATIGNGNIIIANKNIEDIIRDSNNNNNNNNNNNINNTKDNNNNINMISNNYYSNLNRNVNNSQEITKDMITGAANNTLEIDNRVFDILSYGDKEKTIKDKETGQEKKVTVQGWQFGDGWKSIGSDIWNSPNNLLWTARGATRDTILTARTAYNVAGYIPGAQTLIDYSIVKPTTATMYVSKKTGEYAYKAVDKATDKFIQMTGGMDENGRVTNTYGTIMEILTGGVAAIVGTPAIFAAFNEDTDAIIDGNRKITDKEEQKKVLTELNVYGVNGMINSEQDVKNISNDKNAAMRYNPSYGFIADAGEAIFGTILGAYQDTSDLMAMNRYVASDLVIRKDMKAEEIFIGAGSKEKDKERPVTNFFHSQGSIIGTGASNILARDGIKLNENQLMLAVGPAVSEKYWWNRMSSIINKPSDKNIEYEANGNDPVRPTADSNNPIDLVWNGILNGFVGSVIRNKNEHQIKAYYKYIPNYDQYYNQDRSENEKNDVGK